MIKFFRKIRQNLLSEGKTGKYLKYAVGEIILVVIGILIAIAINNWNENRKDRKTENQVLQSVLVDLLSNEEILKKAELKIDRQINETKLFLELMRDEPIDSSFHKVKKLIAFSSEVEDVQLNLSGIEIIISNKIGLIKNDSIKREIVQYPVFFEGYKEQENLMRELKNNRIRPKIKDYISLENIATSSNNFSSNVRGLLSDRTLANDFTDRKWESFEWREDFIQLRKHGQDLIEMIEKELNRK
ncbi:DUF6090 family protein [Bizionia arctica]|uniref:Uncharacterized protein n=1 Tax=Bizionia arctica TaxID=1495645 RepID=A0A917LW00_9FLAO|nr:DUF6090 family protein [Bizionia arctica]GGG60758.1 hypothetical protein GCM10010976_34340 [Bizionia arctica]